MAAVWNAPNTPLGTFVNENYAPRLRRNVFSKLSKSGFLPPGATPELPDTPLGRFVTGSYAPARRMDVFRKLKDKPGFQIPEKFTQSAPEQKLRLLPRELIGREGVRGPYKVSPRVNPEEWEVYANQAGRYFIAPRTELSGLTPEQRGQVKFVDARTEARRGAVTGAYDQLADELGQDQEDTKNRLASLGSLVGSDTQQEFRAVRDVSADAAANVQDQRAQSEAQQENIGAAVSVGEVGDRRALARVEGQDALNELNAQAEQARMELIQAFRDGNREAAAAAAEKEAELEIRRQELEATLRGQELDLLGTQITERGRNARAEISSSDKAAQRLTQLQMSRDRIQAQLAVARLNGDVRMQVALQNNLAAMDRSIVSAQGAYDRAALAEQGRNARTAVTEQGKDRRTDANRRASTAAQRRKAHQNWLKSVRAQLADPDASAVDPLNLVRSGLSLGISPRQVLAGVRLADPRFGAPGHRVSGVGRTGSTAEYLYEQLIEVAGMTPRKASQTVWNLTRARVGGSNTGEG